MLQTLHRSNACDLLIEIDDFTNPWQDSPWLVMVHGFAESRQAWRAWVPHFARDYKVLRLDLRGFGESSAMPQDFPWTMDVVMKDIEAVLKTFCQTPVHLLGAKSGGTFALEFAAQHPELVQTVVGVTPPVIAAQGVDQWILEIKSGGVLAWARSTMKGRLGSQVSDAEVDWWVNDVQGKTSEPSLLGYLSWIPGLDIRASLPLIRCPSLVITTTGSGLRTVDSVRAWHATIPESQLHVIEGDAWHAAGAYPDECSRIVKNFLLPHLKVQM
jgi:pimeloyl-ACP methyl ester carboxylesterase